MEEEEFWDEMEFPEPPQDEEELRQTIRWEISGRVPEGELEESIDKQVAIAYCAMLCRHPDVPWGTEVPLLNSLNNKTVEGRAGLAAAKVLAEEHNLSLGAFLAGAYRDLPDPYQS